MKKLVVIATMVVAVATYKKGSRYSDLSALQNFPPYQETRQYQPLHQQHHPFREQSFKTQQYESYRHRPYRHSLSSYPGQLSFGDQLLFKGYSSPKTASFYDDSSFVTDDQNRTVLGSEQMFQNQTLNDQYPFYRKLFGDDFRFADLYDKPISFDKGQFEQQQASSFGRDLEYLKYGNHGLGYAPVPSISLYGNALPLNEEASTTMAPTTTHKPLQQPTVSSTAPAIIQVHTSATSEPKMVSVKAWRMVTMPTVKSDTQADAATNAASAAVTAKQSPNLDHPSTAMTTEASLPVTITESPIVSFGRQTLHPIEFQAEKFNAPESYYLPVSLKNKLLLGYSISRQTIDSIKNNEQTLLPNRLIELPTAFSSSLKNYVLPENTKDMLKDNFQSSPLNYPLQQESNHGLSSQQSSLPETVNYIPLTPPAETPKITLPSMPIATLSAVSRPLQTVNYPLTTLPRVSASVVQDSSASSGLPLGMNLFSGLSHNVANGQPANVFNGLPGGISSVSLAVPVSVPTLSFGQNRQHVGQLQPLEPVSSSTYSSGLQLHLGGFGGIDYTSRLAHSTPRSTNFEIAKMGLSLPELLRHQPSMFSKVGPQHPFMVDG